MKIDIKTILNYLREYIVRYSITIIVLIVFLAIFVSVVSIIAFIFEKREGDKGNLSEQAVITEEGIDLADAFRQYRDAGYLKEDIEEEYKKQNNVTVIPSEVQSILDKMEIKHEIETEESSGVDCSCEETFEKPVNVVWEGSVFAFMSSGDSLGIKMTSGNKEYPSFFACCVDCVYGKECYYDGNVRVYGKWTGITCAYGNTIFGQCVPSVEIEKIERTKEYTPITHINDLKWFTAKIEEDNRYAGIDIEYPQFIGGEEVEKLNKHVKGTVLEILYADRNQVKEWIANKEEECERDYSGTLVQCSVQLVSEYKVASVVNDIVSLELIVTDYTGGGNGNHSRSYGINWDLKNNRLLDNKDIFCYKEYPNELASIVYENLNKYNAPIDKEYLPYIYKDDIDTTIQSSEFEVLLGYQGLSIVFQPYAILSGSAGFVRVPIPYYDLMGKICF